jgi:hypothetical protein
LNLLIPSAKLVEPQLQIDFGRVAAGLLPLGGRPVVEHILAAFPDRVRGVVAAHEGIEGFRTHLDLYPVGDVALVDVGETESLGETLTQAFALEPELLNSPLVVNLGDTIVRELDADGDFLVYAATEESQRWTLFRLQGGKISALSDKRLQDDPETWKAFVGVFGFARPQRFAELLEAKRDFYAALVDYIDEAPDFRFVEAADWLDCGHADNFYATRRRLINTRYFNSLHVDDHTSTVRKSSSNRSKLIDEIVWATELPRPLRRFIPTVYDASTEPKAPFIEMEFYSYPSLDDCFVYARFDHDSWQKAFGRIFHLTEQFGKYGYEDADLGADLREMYLDKTLARLQSVLDAPPIEVSQGLRVNGIDVPALADVMEELPIVLQRAGLLDSERFSVIHGDLCFGNILFDAKHSLLKVIDPRGRFGRHLHYGDPRYDLAKLSHSALGFYDLIVLEHARVETLGPRSYRLDFRATEYHERIGAIFLRHLRRANYDVRTIRLLESLLFLSMVPLHQDHPHRQRAMLLRGLETYAAHRTVGA